MDVTPPRSEPRLARVPRLARRSTVGLAQVLGAAAGLVASTIGVLLTRGRQTVVYPEQPLTFRLEAPLTVEGSEASFRPASEEDYEQRTLRRPPPQRYGYGAPSLYGYPPPYYYGGFFSPYYGYGFGPSFYFSYGHRGFGRRRW